MTYRITILLLAATIVLGCGHERPKPKSDEEVLSYKEPLVKVNKILVDQDSIRIVSFCNRHQMHLSVSPAGLWYLIKHTGKGDSAHTGKIANIKYSVSLLDGKFCYSSDSSGIKSFKIGEGGVETGLEIGIRMLREGDKAIFILPPNLAYGLLGDEKCIPPRSIIMYQVELVKITDF